ncbi:MAG TPA: carbon-nitrogen hydrolase family protein [Solirubrobacteraceae bacterium]|nr:carbon-nitrogen hydrolase family protein [Solirubrobacteraceae bacterium]
MKVAAVQLNSTDDLAANLAAADRHTRAAAADGAELIVLPEKWTAMGTDQQLRAAAEPLDGRALGWARALAGELGVELIAGSFLEQIPGEKKLANTSVHIGPSGAVRAVYRKLHMFDVSIEGREYRESDIELPGEQLVLSSTATDLELGMSICYDLRFPELYRALAVAGARMFPLPAAFTLATTRDHWQALLRARAIENEAFVVAANQVGAHPGHHRSGGRSMIVDPWGLVLAQAPDAPCHIVAELDLERQRQIREQLPVLANRRPDVYTSRPDAATNSPDLHVSGPDVHCSRPDAFAKIESGGASQSASTQPPDAANVLDAAAIPGADTGRGLAVAAGGGRAR